VIWAPVLVGRPVVTPRDRYVVRSTSGVRGMGIGARWDAWCQSVDAVGAPVVTFDVPRDQIPALAGVHEPMRFHCPDRGGPVVALIVEAKLVLIAAGRRRRQ